MEQAATQGAAQLVGHLPEGPQQMAGVVQPLRDSFKRCSISGQAANQRALSLGDPLPSFKQCIQQYLNPKRFEEIQSQHTPSSQASELAAMKTRPLRAATDPALWALSESASGVGDEADWGQIAGNDGSGDGLNCDQRFGVSGQTSEVELIQTLQRLRQLLAEPKKDGPDRE